MLVHCFEPIHHRRYWLLILPFACALETAGNALRIYGHFNLPNIGNFIAMQCLTVLTPAFFAAIQFALLGKVFHLFWSDSRYTLLVQKWIIYFFVSLDIASLAVQGAGSGLAASAQMTDSDPNTGGHIVFGGLLIQLVGYSIFNALALSCAWRYHHTRGQCSELLFDARLRWGLVTSFISALLVLARTIFRTVEMAEGWVGSVTGTEWYYYTFDAAPVALAVLILAIWHPARYLPKESQEASEVAGKALVSDTESASSDMKATA